MAKIKSVKYKPVMVQTFTGKLVDITQLKNEDIDIVDIAHGLSNLCRYNGHTTRYYSVAEHCVRLANYAYKNYTTEDDFNVKLAVMLLLHDATEAYVGDVIYHLKSKLPDFINFEKLVANQIDVKFDIVHTIKLDNELALLDRRICFDEMYALFNGKIDPYFYENNIKPIGPDGLYTSKEDQMGWTPEEAKKNYLVMATFLGLTLDRVF